MKIPPSAADRFVGAPAADLVAVLIYGPDRGLVRERANALLATLGADPRDPFAFTDLGDEDFKADPVRLDGEMRALAFGGARRLVRARISGDASAGPIVSVLKDVETGALDPAAFLLVETGELTPRSKLRKAFEPAGRAAALACYADGPAELNRLVDTVLSEHGLMIDRDARDALLPFLEGDRGHARMELEKLALYAGPGRAEPISLSDVDASASSGEASALDDIVFNTLGGHGAAADTALSKALTAGVSGVAVCRALMRALLRLDVLRTAIDGGATADAALRAARPPVISIHVVEVKRQLAAWRGPDLARAISRTQACERDLKGSGVRETALVGRLVLALAQIAGRKR